MSRTIIDDGYSDASVDIAKAIERSAVVKDFLPSPQELMKAKTKTRITISVDADTLSFYKQEAKKHGGKYQTMINNLLGAYAQNHKS
jgi:uncharacterized protein (DUF4415 family)